MPMPRVMHDRMRSVKMVFMVFLGVERMVYFSLFISRRSGRRKSLTLPSRLMTLISIVFQPLFSVLLLFVMMLVPSLSSESESGILPTMSVGVRVS